MSPIKLNYMFDYYTSLIQKSQINNVLMNIKFMCQFDLWVFEGTSKLHNGL